MNVAFLTHYSELYGANRSLLDLIRGLVRHGVRPFVVTPGAGPLADELEKLGVPVFKAPLQCWYEERLPGAQNIDRRLFGRIRRARWRWKQNARLIAPLTNQFRDWGIDVVYSNTVVTPIGVPLSRILKKPHIWHLREYAELDYDLKKDWGEFVFRRVVRTATAHIAVSESVSKYYSNAIAPKECAVIYSGIAFESRFDRLLEQARQRPATDNFRFAMVGLIRPKKGQETAIRAFSLLAKSHENVRLTVAGSGQEAPLKRLVSDLGLADKVDFLGFVEEPYRVYLDSDAVLMCSKMEAMGRVTVEAMAASRPVIGNDSGGTSELIQHGQSGLLYDGTPADLANCMASLVGNPKMAMQFGRSGWENARKKFSIEYCSQRVFDVLSACT